MIEFSDLSMNYGPKQVFADFNLTLPSNQVSVIMGESGCGKSTLIKLILGLIYPQKGSVFIAGQR
ncbi:MAG: ATP-binding cassette domain-containing protein [Oligoflexales bacterium]|nr:ATP-binding cassette domain-containing protein [Oligoflexales bacterium]